MGCRRCIGCDIGPTIVSAWTIAMKLNDHLFDPLPILKKCKVMYPNKAVGFGAIIETRLSKGKS